MIKLIKIKVVKLKEGDEITLPSGADILDMKFLQDEKAYIILLKVEKLELIQPAMLEAPQKKIEVALVLDEMFRNWGIDTKIMLENTGLDNVAVFEVHETGKDNMKLDDKVFTLIAQTDIEILEKIKKLKEKYKRVILATGDKKLAKSAKSVAEVIYAPPSTDSKYTCLQHIVEQLKEVLASPPPVEETQQE